MAAMRPFSFTDSRLRHQSPARLRGLARAEFQRHAAPHVELISPGQVKVVCILPTVGLCRKKLQKETYRCDSTKGY